MYIHYTITHYHMPRPPSDLCELSVDDEGVQQLNILI